MTDFSILGKNVRYLKEQDFFKDLNLDSLFCVIFEHAPFSLGGLESYCYQMPQDLETVRYRQQVIQALREKETEQHFRDFLQKMHRAMEYKEYAVQLVEGDGCAHWHLQAAYIYYQAVDQLMVFLQKNNITGFEELLAYCQQLSGTFEYQTAHDCAVSVYEELDKLRYSMYIEGDHIRILSEVEADDILGKIREKVEGYIEMSGRLSRLLPGSLSGTKLEEQIFAYLEKKKPQVFQDMRQFSVEYKEPFDKTMMNFCQEISFYLCFLSFYQRMEQYGFLFCLPEFTDGEMRVTGGYDLSLAYKNHMEGKATIANDYYFSGMEHFFVVTGANQGGKTTFGRSVGQLVYLTNMGLPVPAASARLPYFSGLVTHFSVEESMESGRGKLQEELTRLAPIMHEESRNLFVIINELFTSAATYDAFKMGRQVIRHFLEHDCYGIYVTHIEELAKENEQIVSLVASLQEGSKSLRTYKIVRQPAEGKGYVDAIVDQFGLSYEEIIRRLSNV